MYCVFKVQSKCSGNYKKQEQRSNLGNQSMRDWVTQSGIKDKSVKIRKIENPLNQDMRHNSFD